MENITHSLSGAVLGRTGLGRRVPFGTIALVVAANLPDVDILASFRGRLYYLLHHRGITHSIIGVLALSLVYSFLLWLLNRLRSRPIKTSFPVLLGIVTLATASNPLMDLGNSYGLRPFLPFSRTWLYGDFVPIADPYLWMWLGGTLVVTAEQGRIGRALWPATGFAGLILMVLLAIENPQVWGLVAFWLLGMSTVFVMKRRRAQWGAAAASRALVGVLIYCGFLWGLHAWALHLADSAARERYPTVSANEIAVMPQIAVPWEWNVMFQDRRNVYSTRLSVFRGLDGAVRTFPRHLDDPAVQVALTTCPGQIVADFARFEYSEVRKTKFGLEVSIRDARFGGHDSDDFAMVRIPLSPDLRALPVKTPPCDGEDRSSPF